jgi:hypothetical protein
VLVEVPDDGLDVLERDLNALEPLGDLLLHVHGLAPSVEERRHGEGHRRQDDLVFEDRLLVIEDDEYILAFVLDRDDLDEGAEARERHRAMLPRDRKIVHC